MKPEASLALQEIYGNLASHWYDIAMDACRNQCPSDVYDAIREQRAAHMKAHKLRQRYGV